MVLNFLLCGIKRRENRKPALKVSGCGSGVTYAGFSEEPEDSTYSVHTLAEMRWCCNNSDSPFDKQGYRAQKPCVNKNLAEERLLSNGPVGSSERESLNFS
jgi:hypothetical protein